VTRCTSAGIFPSPSGLVELNASFRFAGTTTSFTNGIPRRDT
jgi:hypothetical protein